MDTNKENITTISISREHDKLCILEKIINTLANIATISKLATTINECNTSKKCCDCFQDLKHYRNKENKEEFRLLVCSNCVSCENKKIVFRTRDANSAINIMNLGKCWIYKQQRPNEFCISSFTISNKKEEMEKVRPSVDFTEGNASSHRILG